MKCLVLIAFTMFLFSLPLVGFSQMICVNGNCDCKHEAASSPNLVVEKSVHIAGILIEEVSQAPFVFEDTIIEVRQPETKNVLTRVQVNAKGEFDLGIIPGGKFRLIVAREKQKGKLERMPLADQPKLISCYGDSDCRIIAVQHLHGTDQPYEFCSPQ